MTHTDFLPYGRQSIDEADIAAVVEALKADVLTTGPRVEAFEQAFAETVGAAHAVVCSNGTAALHMAIMALDIGPGDVCIVPAVTFVATANCARFQGADVVFADVDPDTGLMTPGTLEGAVARAGDRPIRAILPVHLSGRTVDMAGVKDVANAAGAELVEDACHALGSRTSFNGVTATVGSCAQSTMACFSFHPVKTIASGEGGMVTTNDPQIAARLRLARAHGLTRSPAEFQRRNAAFDGDVANPWYYEQSTLGYNYRLPDILCALGQSQLSRLDQFAARRAMLAARYDSLLPRLAPLVRTVPNPPGCEPTLHLYVALIDFETLGATRRWVMEALKERGIGTQVHYIPVPDQPYYVELYGRQDMPGARRYYDRCLSLPLYPAMADSDVDRVVDTLADVLAGAQRRT